MTNNIPKKKKKEPRYEKIVLREEIITTVTNSKREAVIEIPIDFKQIYENAMLHLIRFGASCETALQIYLLTEFDSNKEIIHNENLRKEFNHFCVINDGKRYSDVSIKKALCNLEVSERMIKLSKGVYQLNPVYFWDSSQENRKEAIKNLQHLLSNNTIEI